MVTTSSRAGQDLAAVWTADVVLGSAAKLADADQLTAESWASLWLGEAWARGEIDGESTVGDALRSVVREGAGHPYTESALRAFLLVAPDSVRPLLTDALGAGSAGAGAAWDPTAWTVTDAARYLDPWDCERFLILTVDGPVPHCLLVAINPSIGGVEFIRLMDVDHGRTFFSDWPPDLPPMRRVDADRPQVIAEAADALRLMDAAWPRTADDETASHRALAWVRCRDYLRPFPQRVGLTVEAGTDVVRDFLGREPDAAADSFCAELLLDFGEGYMNDPMAWSPHWVTRFLLDFVPRSVATLSEDDQEALPDVLARWVAFALSRRGVPERWIVPVVAAVQERRADFEELMGEPD
ncbi:MAG TPA: hypothetical protein VES01_05135 [Dermatophilaceae bacterium]|nr:hypothetical protein [Dermatophilaceae bacterium]